MYPKTHRKKEVPNVGSLTRVKEERNVRTLKVSLSRTGTLIYLHPFFLEFGLRKSFGLKLFIFLSVDMRMTKIKVMNTKMTALTSNSALRPVLALGFFLIWFCISGGVQRIRHRSSCSAFYLFAGGLAILSAHFTKNFFFNFVVHILCSFVIHSLDRFVIYFLCSCVVHPLGGFVIDFLSGQVVYSLGRFVIHSLGRFVVYFLCGFFVDSLGGFVGYLLSGFVVDSLSGLVVNFLVPLSIFNR